MSMNLRCQEILQIIESFEARINQIHGGKFKAKSRRGGGRRVACVQAVKALPKHPTL
jgi:hypothetical protein